MKLAPLSVATAFARRVLPTPGGSAIPASKKLVVIAFGIIIYKWFYGS
jgi:hypothetical protein